MVGVTHPRLISSTSPKGRLPDQHCSLQLSEVLPWRKGETCSRGLQGPQPDPRGKKRLKVAHEGRLSFSPQQERSPCGVGYLWEDRVWEERGMWRPRLGPPTISRVSSSCQYPPYYLAKGFPSSSCSFLISKIRIKTNQQTEDEVKVLSHSACFNSA